MRDLTDKHDVIVSAIRESPALLEVSEDGKMVKRRIEIPDDVDASKRTLFVKPLEESMTLDQLTEFFEQSFPVASIRMRRTPETRAFKGSVFVEFKTEEDAQAYMATERLNPQGKPLTVMLKYLRSLLRIIVLTDPLRIGPPTSRKRMTSMRSARRRSRSVRPPLHPAAPPRRRRPRPSRLRHRTTASSRSKTYRARRSRARSSRTSLANTARFSLSSTRAASRRDTFAMRRAAERPRPSRRSAPRA